MLSASRHHRPLSQVRNGCLDQLGAVAVAPEREHAVRLPAAYAEGASASLRTFWISAARAAEDSYKRSVLQVSGAYVIKTQQCALSETCNVCYSRRDKTSLMRVEFDTVFWAHRKIAKDHL